jgi:hypothetical protein
MSISSLSRIEVFKAGRADLLPVLEFLPCLAIPMGWLFRLTHGSGTEPSCRALKACSGTCCLFCIGGRLRSHPFDRDSLYLRSSALRLL